MTIVARDPFSEVVDMRRRWNPEWYTWVTEMTDALNPGAPVAIVAATGLVNSRYTVCGFGGTVTLTLPTPSLYSGRELTIKTIQPQAVVSAASNVVPSTSATPGTAILPAVDGAWATLVSDGTNWIIMAAQPLV